MDHNRAAQDLLHESKNDGYFNLNQRSIKIQQAQVHALLSLSEMVKKLTDRLDEEFSESGE